MFPLCALESQPPKEATRSTLNMKNDIENLVRKLLIIFSALTTYEFFFLAVMGTSVFDKYQIHPSSTADNTMDGAWMKLFIRAYDCSIRLGVAFTLLGVIRYLFHLAISNPLAYVPALWLDLYYWLSYATLAVGLLVVGGLLTYIRVWREGLVRIAPEANPWSYYALAAMAVVQLILALMIVALLRLIIFPLPGMRWWVAIMRLSLEVSIMAIIYKLAIDALVDI